MEVFFSCANLIPNSSPWPPSSRRPTPALTLCLPAYGAIQVRLSEAFTVLPFLFPAAVPGVAVGCLVANLLSPYGLIDVVCGTAATLLAALWTSRIRA